MYRLVLALIVLLIVSACSTFEQLAEVAQREQLAHAPLALELGLRIDSQPSEYTDSDVDQLISALWRRLEALSIVNAEILVEGDMIRLQIPAIDDVDIVIDTVTGSAILEFVDFSGISMADGTYVGGRIATTEDPNRDNAKLHPNTGAPFETILTGNGLSSALVQYDDMIGNWMIVFELTEEGGQIFGDYTQTHIGEPLAIVLDGVLLSAPVIQSRLDAGGVIIGNFTQAEAQALAAQLNSGSLPLPLVFESIDVIAD